jgi:hypothetical protein
VWTGWIHGGPWLAGYAALAIALAQHNLIASPALRITSFFELSVLRFVLPVIGALDGAHYLETTLAALLFYTYLRYLSYIESKGVLDMPERRAPAFQLKQTLMIAPLVGWVALLSRSTVLVELLAYFCVVYAAWAVARRATHNK